MRRPLKFHRPLRSAVVILIAASVGACAAVEAARPGAVVVPAGAAERGARPSSAPPSRLREGAVDDSGAVPGAAGAGEEEPGAAPAAARSLSFATEAEHYWAFWPNGTAKEIFPANSTRQNDACAQNRCADCVAQHHCGWCRTTWTCMQGDAHGPKRKVDGNWTSLDCPSDQYSNEHPHWVFHEGDQVGYPQPACQYSKRSAVPHNRAPIPVEFDGSVCRNGGKRYWNTNNMQGMTSCTCPEGWAGHQCEVCTRDSVCPGVSDPMVNESCAQAMLPFTHEEENTNKHYTCTCVGPSKSFCDYYGGVDMTRISVNYVAAENRLDFYYFTSSGALWPNDLQTGIIFAGNATGCGITKQVECPTGSQYYWSGNQPCGMLLCSVDFIWAPSPFGKGHCKSHDETHESYRWRQCPTFGLDSFKHMQIVCQYDPAHNGTYLCAFEAPMGPLALQCQTGSCISTDIEPPPTPPPPAPPSFTKHDWYTLILAAPLCVGLAFFLCCGAVLWRRNQELKWLSSVDASRRQAKAVAPHTLAQVTLDDSTSPRAPAVGDAKAGAPSRAAAARVEEQRLRARTRTLSGARPLLRGFSRESAGDEDLAGGTTSTGAGASTPVFEGVGTLPTTGEGADPGKLVFAWSNITYKVHKGRQVLHGVSGAAHSSMFALLGPSGAGKTTLLDILAGRKSTAGGSFDGEVTLNGVHMAPWQLRRTVGYVLQDDVMMGTQTVREYLLLQARLRLPSRVTLEERYRRVDAALGELGLRHVADTKIGGEFVRGVSGGEKRRISIAAELISDAQVLLLDEPTSGLDSASAKAVVDALARVAATGRIVIMSIHQPRSYIWSVFDAVLLLAQTGETLYSGPREGILPHFESLEYPCPPEYNPADFLLDTVAMLDEESVAAVAAACPAFGAQDVEGTVGAAAAERLAVGAGRGTRGESFHDDVEALGVAASPTRAGAAKDEPATRAIAVDPAARFYREGASWMAQAWELSIRASMNIVRDPTLLLLNYGLTIFIAVGVGMVFKALQFDFYGLQDRIGFFAFCFLFFSMTSLSSIGAFREERLLFLRERAMGAYSTGAYYVAKVCADVLPMRVLPPVLFSGIVYWQIGLTDEPLVFARFTATLVMVNVACASMCLAIGALVPSTSLANLIASTLQLYELLFAGLMSHNVPVDWSALFILQRLSYLNYAFEILAVNELVGTSYNLAPRLPDGTTPASFPASGSVIASTFGLQLDKMARDMALLGTGIGIFLVCLYITLRFFVREKR